MMSFMAKTTMKKGCDGHGCHGDVVELPRARDYYENCVARLQR